MLEWFVEHAAASLSLAGVSLLMFLAALIVIPWAVVRLPADYFSGERRPESFLGRRRFPVLWLLLQVVKNLAGAVLVAAGVAMLLLPGQGVLTILVGMMLMNFPGKFRLERWIVSRGPTLRIINYLRFRRGKPPLVLDSNS
ncbi:MAG: PGPGW domain-containing protein [Desulfonatronovibrionaceae bacterium]